MVVGVERKRWSCGCGCGRSCASVCDIRGGKTRGGKRANDDGDKNEAWSERQGWVDACQTAQLCQ